MSLRPAWTVTSPGLVGCLNCRWSPRVRASRQPSASSIRITSRALSGTNELLFCARLRKDVVSVKECCALLLTTSPSVPPARALRRVDRLEALRRERAGTVEVEVQQDGR